MNWRDEEEEEEEEEEVGWRRVGLMNDEKWKEIKTGAYLWVGVAMKDPKQEGAADLANQKQAGDGCGSLSSEKRLAAVGRNPLEKGWPQLFFDEPHRIRDESTRRHDNSHLRYFPFSLNSRDRSSPRNGRAAWCQDPHEA